MSKQYDLVVLGGGPGGYVAAIRASQLGLKTAIVEKEKLGGTCLHSGCIPTKALLRSAEVYSTTLKSENFGVEATNVRLNFTKVQARKNKLIEQLHQGVKHLIKRGKIDVYNGYGRLLGPSIFSPLPGTISVELGEGKDNLLLVPKHVIIATGSQPRSLPNLKIDGKYVLSSEDALQMENLPKSIIIIGGGVIGVEWASMLSDFGVKVTILENEKNLISTEDNDVSRELQRVFKRRKIKVVTNANVLPNTLEINNDITINADVNGSRQQFSAEKIIVAVGRTPNINNIGLGNTNIEVKNGAIVTNEFYQTKESHIYAIGDVIGGLQLAHVASHEGIVAVEHLTNKSPMPINYTHISRCMYTSPEIASVGITEAEAINNGFEIKTGKFSFRTNGKALLFGQYDGFVKVIANKETDDILGIHIIGPSATELVSEASLAKVLDATPWEIGTMIHPHPTLSEVIGEAALAVDNRAIHL